MAAQPNSILDVEHLTVGFPVTAGVFLRRVGEVRAVDDVSFSVGRGETLGLVGESGCGKTTVGRAILNILRTTAYGVEISGTIRYHAASGAVDLAALGRRAMRPYRADLQMVFQDPYASLNPRQSVAQIVGEPLAIHSKTSKHEQAERVAWLLDKVGLSPEQANRYPHEFSGGQRQRIGIARALATNPKLVVADEPVSALDVSVQAQVINLLQDLQQELGLSYLFVSHDLSVVRHISNRVAVMYLGHIVEVGDGDTLYRRPLHPYTRALLAAAPRPTPGPKHTRHAKLPGDIPSPINKPSGCAFRTRCPIARASCAEAAPPLSLRDGRLVACPYSE
ncbi:MAG TPA: oligopeptide/dipeptide ABC transporter ATP-binding protein [Gammaproteobacteria bacterium]|jgi:oligopeptide/dipeptide ABC transporter ATP-binding protein|nr:oligopeptide/dipeptide ABC transporter ATP-binding protein [Gammaproteobacteria bacterium]